MKLLFSEHAWDDYLYWQKTDKSILKRVNLLIQDIQRSPFEGIGKPEPLRHALSGFWSRRINGACQYFCVRGIRLSRVGKAFAEGNGELVHGLSPFQH